MKHNWKQRPLITEYRAKYDCENCGFVVVEDDYRRVVWFYYFHKYKEFSSRNYYERMNYETCGSILMKEILK